MAVAPTSTQRVALADRLNLLHASLKPSSEGMVRRNIAMVVAMIPAPGTDQEDPRTTVGAYVAAMSDMPAWATEEACAAALRGKVGKTNGRFRPAPGELHAHAEGLREAVLIEVRRIDRILKAKVETPRLSAEKRKEIAAAVRAKMITGSAA